MVTTTTIDLVITADDMRRDFKDREDLTVYLRDKFSFASSPETVAEVRGGRQAGLERLAATDLDRYAETRNALSGSVTNLSPYLRHGMLTLTEVRDHALEHDAPRKFINELAWRDYWQRMHKKLGRGIWNNIEPYKTGFSAEHYASKLPCDIAKGDTGTCLDIFIKQLITTGYIHNHARMWLAAYVVHWRHVQWQAGARWFLEHLIDGDPASNNLSWQWVASTFSQKPYYMNADNIRKYASIAHPELANGTLDPFEGDYNTLSAELFPQLHTAGGKR